MSEDGFAMGDWSLSRMIWEASATMINHACFAARALGVSGLLAEFVGVGACLGRRSAAITVASRDILAIVGNYY